jgi:hypothetical protein
MPYCKRKIRIPINPKVVKIGVRKTMIYNFILLWNDREFVKHEFISFLESKLGANSTLMGDRPVFRGVFTLRELIFLTNKYSQMIKKENSNE